MFKSDASRIGYIILAIILFFGSFCIFDLVRQYNITSKVIGYFKHSTEVVKISDFEYDITSLLFTNSGSKENEYFAEIKTSPVADFDKTKGYTVLINNSPASKVKGEYTYINVNFMNTFNSMQDTELLTDILNIKINFFADGTKIAFVTQNGEKAVKLWSSFIQKNGFKLKIVEDNFKSTIEADNIPTYTINLYVNGEIYQTLSVNTLSDLTLPSEINNRTILNWTDIDGNVYEKLPLKNINLYASFLTVNEPCLSIKIDKTNVKIFEASDKNGSSVGSWDSFTYLKYSNEDFNNIVNGDTTEVISTYKVSHNIKIFDRNLGQIGKNSFLGNMLNVDFVITNQSNSKAIDFSILITLKTEDGKSSGIAFLSIKEAPVDNFPEESNLVLENADFDELQNQIKTSAQNKDCFYSIVIDIAKI